MSEGPRAEGGPEESVATGSVRTVAAWTLASRVLGLGRDVLTAAFFGVGPVLDAFTLAFRIPNLARRWFGEGAFAVAVIPALTRVEAEEGAEARDRLATGLIGGVFLFTAALGAAGATLLAGAVATGALVDERDRLFAILAAILLAYLPLICVVAQLAAVLQSVGRFAAAAAVPAVLNAVWIATLVAFAATGRTGDAWSARMLAISLVAAGALQICLLAVAAWRAGLRPRRVTAAARARIVPVLKSTPAVAAAVGVSQINVAVDSAVAWLLVPEGGVSALYFGQRLYEFPVGLIGVAVGTVIYPAMTRREAAGDRAGLVATAVEGARLVTFVGLPAGAGLMLVAGPLVDLFFGYGAFSDGDAARTAAVVMACGAGVWPGMLLPVLQRAHLAAGATGFCVRVALAGAALNAILDVPTATLAGEAGLAAVTSGVAFLQAALFWRGLRNVDAGVMTVVTGRPFAKMAAATACMAAAVFVAASLISAADRLIAVAVPVGVGIVIYFGVAALLRLPDAGRFFRARSLG